MAWRRELLSGARVASSFHPSTVQLLVRWITSWEHLTVEHRRCGPQLSRPLAPLLVSASAADELLSSAQNSAMLSFLSPKRSRFDSTTSTAPHTPSTTSTPLPPSFPSASSASSTPPSDPTFSSSTKDGEQLHPDIDYNLWPVLGQGAPTWTTDLGLSPPTPARVRMSSARSRGELEREAQSTMFAERAEHLDVGGGGRARLPLRRSRSDSSAGSSAFGDRKSVV